MDPIHIRALSLISTMLLSCFFAAAGKSWKSMIFGMCTGIGIMGLMTEIAS